MLAEGQKVGTVTVILITEVAWLGGVIVHVLPPRPII